MVLQTKKVAWDWYFEKNKMINLCFSHLKNYICELD